MQGSVHLERDRHQEAIQQFVHSKYIFCFHHSFGSSIHARNIKYFQSQWGKYILIPLSSFSRRTLHEQLAKISGSMAKTLCNERVAQVGYLHARGA
jgi:hypothetical protein